MKLLKSFENTHKEGQKKDLGIQLMKSTSDRTKIVGWVRDLYNLGAFRQSTAFAHGLDAATASKTLKEEGKLRIDRQRVIGINERAVTTNQFAIGKGQNRQFFDSKDAAQAALGKKKAKIMEVPREVTVADGVWTLFAAQIDSTHNQIFVYNNQNFLGAMGVDTWVNIWQDTLDNACTVIVTPNTATVPAGIDQAYDATVELSV